MMIVENARHIAEDVGNGIVTALKVCLVPVRDIPQRLTATARLMAVHPQAERMTATQRIKVAAKLITDRPGPQHLDGWT